MKFRFSLWLVAGLMSSLFFACRSGVEEQAAEKGQLYIVTTTGMIGDAVANIVGDKAKVEALMGPGVDPHLYKATQSDLSKLNRAEIVFYNGLYLEGRMEDILEKLALSKPAIAVGTGLDEAGLIKVGSGEGQLAHDPHIWFDVTLWMDVVNVVRDGMIKNDPDNKELYEKNAEKYIARLKELHAWVKQQMDSIPQERRVLVTAHDAFHYFGRQYQIEVEALQGVSTASDFGLKDVTNLVDMIVRRGIKAVFVESSVSQRSVNAVVEGCRNRGHEVRIGGTLYSDAMGDAGTPEGQYIGMVKHNVNTIVEGLK